MKVKKNDAQMGFLDFLDANCTKFGALILIDIILSPLKEHYKRLIDFYIGDSYSLSIVYSSVNGYFNNRNAWYKGKDNHK